MVGFTVIDDPEEPVFQLYVCAPLAEMVILSPPHIVAVLGFKVTVGAELTIIITLALSVQPLTSVTTTLYVVVVVGEIT